MNGFRVGRFLLLMACLFTLSGCAETQLISHYVKKMPWPGEETARSEGNYKVGKPYKIDGRWYHPKEDFDLVETGMASWYGPGFHAKRTANGEIYDQNKLTAAHRTLQMPSLVQVTNLENGRSVVVRVNDRGPYKNNRIIDVSKRAAELLGFKGQGTAKVRIRVLDEESKIMASAAKAGKNTKGMTFEHASLSAWTAEGQTRQPSGNTSKSLPPRMAGPYGTLASAERNWNLKQNVAMKGSDLPESLQAPVVTAGELQDDVDLQQAIHREAEPAAGQPAPLPPIVTTEKTAVVPSLSMPPTAILSASPKAENAPEPRVLKSEPARGGNVYVLAGSFSVYDNVKKMVEKFSGQAEARVDSVTIQDRKLYKLSFGPFLSKEEARPLLDKIVRSGNPTARLIVD